MSELGPKRRRCTAHRSDGKRCNAYAIRGGTICRVHGGSAPQVRAKARERLLGAVDEILGELLRLAKAAESESVRVAAIKDILDRAGFKPSERIEISMIRGEVERLAELLGLDPEELLAEAEALAEGS